MHVHSLSGASRYTKSSSCSPIGLCTKQPHVQPKVSAGLFANRSLHLGVCKVCTSSTTFCDIANLSCYCRQKRKFGRGPSDRTLHLSHILVLSQYVWIRSIGQLCLPQLYVVQRYIHVVYLVLGCRPWLQDRIGNVIYERLTRFSSFDTRHAYLGR